MDNIKFNIDLKVTGKYGLNKIYSGIHWAKRKKLADSIHLLVVSSLRNQKIPRKIFEVPVEITIFYNSRMDIDNHGFLTKMIIDALKGYLIQEDSKKYVCSITQQFWRGEGICVNLKPKQ